MKKIYIIYTEKYGENQLVFDDTFKLLDAWSMNDANYRHEYMNGFLKTLGIQVERQLPYKTGADVIRNKQLIIDGLKSIFGCSDEELV